MTPYVVLLLAIYLPKASHLRQQPCQRPQLCSPTKGQVRFTHRCRYEASSRNDGRFISLHVYKNLVSTEFQISMVLVSQHHRDKEKLDE